MTAGTPTQPTNPTHFAVQLNGDRAIQIDRWTFAPSMPYQVLGLEAAYVLTGDENFLELVTQGVLSVFINDDDDVEVDSPKRFSEFRTRIFDDMDPVAPGGHVHELPDVSLPVYIRDNTRGTGITNFFFQDHGGNDLVATPLWVMEGVHLLNLVDEAHRFWDLLNNNCFGPGIHTLYIVIDAGTGEALSGEPAVKYLETLVRRERRRLGRAEMVTVQTGPEINLDEVQDRRFYLQKPNEQIEHLRGLLGDNPPGPDAFPKAIRQLDPGLPLSPVVETYLNDHVTPWMVFKHLTGWGRPHVSHTGTLSIFSHPDESHRVPIELEGEVIAVRLDVPAGGRSRMIIPSHHIEMLQRSESFFRLATTVDPGFERVRIYISGRAVPGGYQANIDNLIPTDRVRDFMRLLP